MMTMVPDLWTGESLGGVKSHCVDPCIEWDKNASVPLAIRPQTQVYIRSREKSLCIGIDHVVASKLVDGQAADERSKGSRTVIAGSAGSRRREKSTEILDAQFVAPIRAFI